MAHATITPSTRLHPVTWGKGHKLGDETKDKDYPDAVAAYRALRIWHTNAGLYRLAGEFQYREGICDEKARWQGDWNSFKEDLSHAISPLRDWARKLTDKGRKSPV